MWSKRGFPGGPDGKESTCNVGDLGSIPGLGRTPGEGHGYPLQYSGQENSMDRGGWQALIHGVIRVIKKSSLQITKDTPISQEIAWALGALCQGPRTKTKYIFVLYCLPHLQIFLKKTFIWLHHVLVAAHEIFPVQASAVARGLSYPLRHVGS